jgi:hypothetical protein
MATTRWFGSGKGKRRRGIPPQLPSRAQCLYVSSLFKTTLAKPLRFFGVAVYTLHLIGLWG